MDFLKRIFYRIYQTFSYIFGILGIYYTEDYRNAKYKDYYEFIASIRNGHPEIALLLLNNENVKNNIAANNYETFRLACRMGYTNLVTSMLAISDVVNNAAILNNQAYEWARRNNHLAITSLLQNRCQSVRYYLVENGTEANTEKADNHKESAMKALTEQEENELNEILGKYYSLTQDEIEYYFQDLINFLNIEYLKEPAKIEVDDGQTITLPLTWEEFENLQKEAIFKEYAGTYNKAMQAYWQHQPHAKLRYFIEPNMWMSPDAKYVTRTAINNRIVGTANYKQYKTLIAQLWGVACEKDHETKLNFTSAFYDLNRAYNQIDKHHNSNGLNNILGDMPNCSYGIRRRLFFAAQLLSNKENISTELIDDYIKTLVNNHYKKLYNNLEINEKAHLINLIEKAIGMNSSEDESQQIMQEIESIHNKDAMLSYYHTIFKICNPKSQASLLEMATKKNIVDSSTATSDAKSSEYHTTLKDYDINKENIEKFITDIQTQFQSTQLSQAHKDYISNKFNLKTDECHLTNLYYFANLHNIFYLDANKISNHSFKNTSASLTHNY